MSVVWNLEVKAVGGRLVTLSQETHEIDRDLVRLMVNTGSASGDVELVLNEDDVVVLLECALTRLRFNQKKGKK